MLNTTLIGSNLFSFKKYEVGILISFGNIVSFQSFITLNLIKRISLINFLKKKELFVEEILFISFAQGTYISVFVGSARQ